VTVLFLLHKKKYTSMVAGHFGSCEESYVLEAIGC
jgi:hypothetical protein